MIPCIAATCSRELRDHEIAARQQLCDPCVHTMRAWLKSIPGQMIVICVTAVLITPILASTEHQPKGK